MPDLTVTGSEFRVTCRCGDELEFDDIHDGWQHIYPCDCGEYVSVQIGDPIIQFVRGPEPGAVRANTERICGFDMGEGDSCALVAGHGGQHS